MKPGPSPRKQIDLIEKVINYPYPLISHSHHRWENHPLVPYSDLWGAVQSLARRGRKVAIVTGFYIPGATPPATETDGPPGALILAEGLRSMGMEVLLLSDLYTLSTLSEGFKVLGLSDREIPLISFPMEHPEESHVTRSSNDEPLSLNSLRFARRFLESGPGKGLSHLLFIERVGPNHTEDSIVLQGSHDETDLAGFRNTVPPSMRNRCINARGEDITRFTGKTHLLLQPEVRSGLSFESIGIGDRGNEIGSGRVPWKVFSKEGATGMEALFCCRVATDFFLSCGISNWGAYALLAGVALNLGAPEVLNRVTPEREMEVLDHLVRNGPSVDGITGTQGRSVDGIAFDQYIRIIEKTKEIALDRNR